MGINTIKTIKIKIENTKYSIYKEFVDMFFNGKINWDEYIKLMEAVNRTINELQKQLIEITGE